MLIDVSNGQYNYNEEEEGKKLDMKSNYNNLKNHTKW